MSLSPQDTIIALAQGDGPVLETILQMTINTYERSGLDPLTYSLVRIAALVALDAPPMSYLLNVGAAEELGISLETIRGTIVAVAPLVGTAKVVAASGQLLKALDLAEELGDEP